MEPNTPKPTLVIVGPRPPRTDEWKSMIRYTDGVADALADDFEITRFSASHWNPPRLARRLSTRYRDHVPMPRHWMPPPKVVHFTDIYVAVHARRFDSVRLATLHDFITLDMVPRWPPALLYWRGVFQHSLRSVKHLDGLIVPSRHTAARAIRETGIDEGRISVVPVLVPEEIQAPPAGHVRKPDAILSVGTTAPYKNLPLLLHALSRPDLSHARLIRVGEPLTHELRALAARLGLTERIEERTHVTNAQLRQAFHEATVLAQPSLTEGFGMPVAEAMASGLPVVASDGGALPEVVGEAGAVLPLRSHETGATNLDDADALAATLARILGDTRCREQMAAKGLERAQRFRKPAVRAALLDAYGKASRR